MAYPSVTYTFVNATSADATQVNQNFTDVINGFSDGSKDANLNDVAVGGTLEVTGIATFQDSLKIKEGIAQPTTAAGYVQFYVDTTTSQLRALDGAGNIYEIALNPI